MIRQVTGIARIRMLYLQLLYQCNFACRHCFHGRLLREPDRYTPGEVRQLLAYFKHEYDLQAVTFLGGEPLLYPGIAAVAADAQRLGLAVEICTNGHRGFYKRLRAMAPHLDKLRVSLDGLETTHDSIRQAGSFAGAIETLRGGLALGLTTGVTTTVTQANIGEVPNLVRLLDGLGVAELKLHRLRLVGNAAIHADLEVRSDQAYVDLHRDLEAIGARMTVTYDSDLLPTDPAAACGNLVAADRLERVEVDPRGGLTVSCKAVGRNVNAFRWDRAAGVIVYEPHVGDELTQAIPDVVYRSVG